MPKFFFHYAEIIFLLFISDVEINCIFVNPMILMVADFTLFTSVLPMRVLHYFCLPFYTCFLLIT